MIHSDGLNDRAVILISPDAHLLEIVLPLSLNSIVLQATAHASSSKILHGSCSCRAKGRQGHSTPGSAPGGTCLLLAAVTVRR